MRDIEVTLRMEDETTGYYYEQTLVEEVEQYKGYTDEELELIPLPFFEKQVEDVLEQAWCILDDIEEKFASCFSANRIRQVEAEGWIYNV